MVEVIFLYVLPEKKRLGSIRAITAHYRGPEGIDQSACSRRNHVGGLASDVFQSISGGYVRSGLDDLGPELDAELISSREF